MTQMVSVERQIAFPASEIFAILADPARHSEIDGSGMVQAVRGDASTLAMGSKFGMDMKFGPVPYKISSTVVEFEQDKLIAWAHVGKHRWRYELFANDEGTLVRETFDWSTAMAPKFIELMGYPKKHPANMERTLERLAGVVEAK
jgi:uncharacterized protein YndB with AHSA1/START domain